MHFSCISGLFALITALPAAPKDELCLGRIKKHNEGSKRSLKPLCLPTLTILIPFFLFSPGAICMQAWSLERSAIVVIRSRRPMLQKANATWSARERRPMRAEDPTDCPSTGWSWVRSRHAAVSLALSISDNTIRWVFTTVDINTLYIRSTEWNKCEMCVSPESACRHYSTFSFYYKFQNKMLNSGSFSVTDLIGHECGESVRSGSET